MLTGPGFNVFTNHFCSGDRKRTQHTHRRQQDTAIDTALSISKPQNDSGELEKNSRMKFLTGSDKQSALEEKKNVDIAGLILLGVRI